MATIKEIAKYTGVSIGTVDRVLHNRGAVSRETREKIQKAMEELDYKPNLVAQGLAVCKKNLRFVCFIYDDPSHPFFRPLIRAMREKAKELEAYGVETEFVNYSEYIGNDLRRALNPGVQRMISQKLTEYVSRNEKNFDGVVTIGTSILRGAYGQFTVPVVNYNDGADEEGILAYVGADYVKSGRIAMGLTALIGGPKAKVLVLSEGTYGSDSYLKRLKGYCLEGKEKYPGIKVCDVIDFSSESEETEKIIRESLDKHPEIDFVYVINPRDYSICRKIREMASDRQIHIITNDMTEEVENLLKEGIVSATITQQPEIQGSRALELLFQYAAYGKMPEPRIQYTKQEICIAQSL